MKLKWNPDHRNQNFLTRTSESKAFGKWDFIYNHASQMAVFKAHNTDFYVASTLFRGKYTEREEWNICMNF